MSNDAVDVNGILVRPEGVIFNDARGSAITGHHIVEEDGTTRKERNMKLQHEIPLLTLVEVQSGSMEGLRLFVQGHTRDCDGTPLYNLCFKWRLVGIEHSVHNPNFVKNSTGISTGHNPDNLEVIKSHWELMAYLIADGYFNSEGRPIGTWFLPEQESLQIFP
jgi:hypothetical protein